MSVESFITQLSKLDMISSVPYNAVVHNDHKVNGHQNGHHVNSNQIRAKTEMAANLHEHSQEEKQQLDVIDNQISNLESKIETFWEICKVLEEEFVTSVRNAEIEHDFKLISKANSLKRKSERKMVEIEELEKELDMTLEKKRQFLYHK